MIKSNKENINGEVKLVINDINNMTELDEEKKK